MEKQVTIDGTTYRFEKVDHRDCTDCDIYKAEPPGIFDTPLCCKYNARGKRIYTYRGLVANFCARHPAYLFKKID